MPVLEVVDDSGERIRGAATNVIAAMLFPQDEEARRNLRVAAPAFAVSYWEDMAERFPAMAGLSKMFSRLSKERFEQEGGLRAVAGINATKYLDDAMRREAYRGQAAGEALLFMLTHHAAHCGEANLRDASVRTSQVVVAALAGKRKDWGRNLVWRRFRGVSHLWAAYRLSGEKNLLDALDGDRLGPFLANAEFLRREAEHLPRYHSEDPLQPPSETWRAPSIMPMPAPTAAIPNWTDQHAKLLRQARLNL